MNMLRLGTLAIAIFMVTAPRESESRSLKPLVTIKQFKTLLMKRLQELEAAQAAGKQLAITTEQTKQINEARKKFNGEFAKWKISMKVSKFEIASFKQTLKDEAEKAVKLITSGKEDKIKQVLTVDKQQEIKSKVAADLQTYIAGADFKVKAKGTIASEVSGKGAALTTGVKDADDAANKLPPADAESKLNLLTTETAKAQSDSTVEQAQISFAEQEILKSVGLLDVGNAANAAYANAIKAFDDKEVGTYWEAYQKVKESFEAQKKLVEKAKKDLGSAEAAFELAKKKTVTEAQLKQNVREQLAKAGVEESAKETAKMAVEELGTETKARLAMDTEDNNVLTGDIATLTTSVEKLTKSENDLKVKYNEKHSGGTKKDDGLEGLKQEVKSAIQKAQQRVINLTSLLESLKMGIEKAQKYSDDLSTQYRSNYVDTDGVKAVKDTFDTQRVEAEANVDTFKKGYKPVEIAAKLAEIDKEVGALQDTYDNANTNYKDSLEAAVTTIRSDETTLTGKLQQLKQEIGAKESAKK